MTAPQVLIIVARFYDHIADGLLTGASQALAAAGMPFTTLTVPGVLELPGALRYAVRAMEMHAIDDHYAGYVVLGCAIEGETHHYHHVCTEAFRGVQEIALQHSLAVGNGILTVRNEKQALDRALPERKNLGGQAARACLRMMELKRQFHLV